MYDKKLAMFYILEILKNYSDKDHLLKQKDIIDKLNNIYHIDIERKTIASTIDLLIELDYDILKEKGGVYLNERDFDETEIKFLIDAIYSSKTISGEQAKELSKKIYSSLSNYQRKDYSYIHKSSEITRSNNKEFFYNIDIITEAIKLKKKIKFNYLTYDNKGNIIERKNGYTYTVSPYFLVNNFGKYYLICGMFDLENHTTFRLDYISNIELTDEDITPISDVKSLGKDFNITKYINDHVYMFGGNIITAKVLIKKDYAITYIYDWFGKNARLVSEDNQLYAYIKTDDNAFIYWALQYCEEFKVIEPQYIKEKMINYANMILDDYK